MARAISLLVLPVFALCAALLGESVFARQGEEGSVLPGVAVETLGQSPVVGEGNDDLVLLRVTIQAGASIPASDELGAAVVLVEEGRVGVTLELAGGEASLMLAGGNGPVPLAPGTETLLAPGDAISSGEGARVGLHNAGDVEATFLYAAVTATGDPLPSTFFQDASGMFGVETFACPEGMSMATFEPDACEPSAASLVQWSIASEQFDTPLGSDEATVSGATTTWQGLPSGTYFIELTAEAFAAGYGDYFIPSSNQVTRQDERTTRIYVDLSRSRESINAYVFVGDPASP